MLSRKIVNDGLLPSNHDEPKSPTRPTSTLQTVLALFNNNTAFWTAPRTNKEKHDEQYPSSRLSIETWAGTLSFEQQQQFKRMSRKIFQALKDHGLLEDFERARIARKNGFPGTFARFFEQHPYAIDFFCNETHLKNLSELIKNYNDTMRPNSLSKRTCRALPMTLEINEQPTAQDKKETPNRQHSFIAESNTQLGRTGRTLLGITEEPTVKPTNFGSTQSINEEPLDRQASCVTGNHAQLGRTGRALLGITNEFAEKQTNFGSTQSIDQVAPTSSSHGCCTIS